MIYLLEDDSAIRELVVYTLCSTGLEATGFAAPSEFYDAMERALPELLILDIMLPEEDGLSILRFGIVTPAAAQIAALEENGQAQSGAVHNGIPGYAAQTDSHASINPLLLILLPLRWNVSLCRVPLHALRC